MKIEYEIKINDEGRPYIEISGDNKTLEVEDNFFAYEIVRFSISDLLEKEENLSENVRNALIDAGGVVQALSDKIAKMIIERNDAMGDIDDIINPNQDN